ncbi:MAG TPA: hypothetical protein VFA67_01770 [Candidatus Sulfotelmatobacter sp.]|nr:hypothetical protein [Candidatus Sulfotelmatobacter sp.]
MTPPSSPDQSTTGNLIRRARLPGMRVLAWDGDLLYASRRYRLFCAKMGNFPGVLHWQSAGEFHPPWSRRLSVANRFTARLMRDGLHALAVLPSGALVAAVPGAVIARNAQDPEFRRTFTVTRGTRPLHIAAVPGGKVFWGEYWDNPSRQEVHIYASADGGLTWSVAHIFPKGAVRHVHNIVHDPWQNCLWVLTGDYGDECRILRASCDFSSVEVALQGNQQARAVAAVPTEAGLYFASDTPLEQNFIYLLDRKGALSRLAPINGSSIYGCRVSNRLFFSTMVEPSDVNRDRTVRVYGSKPDDPEHWDSPLSWQKDRWPMKFFQYGNAFFPGGNNSTPYLAVTTIAVQSDDLVTSIYSVGS